MKDAFSSMSCNDTKFRSGDGSFEDPEYNWFWEYEASPSKEAYYETLTDTNKK